MLAFTMLAARPSAQTASPSITFRLRIEDLSGEPIHALALRCQARIEPRGRRYTHEEQARLYELFGDASQWGRTLQPLTWSQVAVLVPAFANRIDIDVPVPCTYDLEVASAKYLHGLRDGDVPLAFVFSGTAFRTAADGPGFAIDPVPWDREAPFRLPAAVWHATMDQFFPGGGWMRVRRDTLDRLQAFRGQHALVSWDDAIDRLLQPAAEPLT